MFSKSLSQGALYNFLLVVESLALTDRLNFSLLIPHSMVINHHCSVHGPCIHCPLQASCHPRIPLPLVNTLCFKTQVLEDLKCMLKVYGKLEAEEFNLELGFCELNKLVPLL